MYIETTDLLKPKCKTTDVYSHGRTTERMAG